MEYSNSEITLKLKTQIKDLIKLYEACFIEKEELKKKSSKLQLELEHTTERIKELEEEKKKLTLANGLIGGEQSNDEAKQMVNKIVREIDKCIALLNK
jgi:predicted nuclease with TOPRIM domain